MPHSTTRLSAAKASRPAGYPLFPHATGRWAKKVRGRLIYFGAVTEGPDFGRQAALERWLEEKDDWLAGRVPQRNGKGLTVKSLVNAYLNTKKKLVENGEMTAQAHVHATRAGKIMAETLGRTSLVSMLTPHDFGRLRDALAAVDTSPATLAVDIGRIRAVLNWAYKNDLIERPPRYGSAFDKPSASILRRHRAARGSMMFERDEIRAMLDAAGEPLKTMILLGINCGLGSADTARLPVHAIDLQSGWLDFPRPKTGIPRRAKLWPETVAGIRQALDTRPAKMRPDAVGLVFVEADGRPWVRSRGAERLTRELRSMLKPLGLWKPGRAFYGLRRATETVGGTDQAALNMVMGHAAAASDMGAIYRQRVDDARLEAVAERIRSWLWPAGSDAEGGAV